jgi:hypothetical protein
MHRATRFLVLGLVLAFSDADVKANVVVATSLGLTQFQVAPSIGTFITLSPFTASANAQAQDDLSGANSQFNQLNDGSTAASAVTALANASAAASALSLTVNSAGGVRILGVTSFASSTGQGGLGDDFGGTGSFEIRDSSNPSPENVNVVFSATLSGSQSLTTDGAGVFATSEIIFTFSLPDLGSTLLSLDNPLSIGPSTSLVSPYGNMLTSTVQLQTNTEYAFIAEADAESSGFNSAPEPSFSLTNRSRYLCHFVRQAFLAE